jgi:threonine dehydrogenase-like Zn-dependent dehydrogenase
MTALILDPTAAAGVRFVADRARPKPAAGEALIRVRVSGICSTDLELSRGYMGFAGVPGHEFVGQVEEGPTALVGRRVVAEINCLDAAFDPGDAERRKHDPRRTVLGIVGRDGAFAEFVTAPIRNCHVVPDEISDQQAVFVEPLAAAIQVMRDCPIDRSMRATVLGTGRLGILCAQVMSLTGCALTVVGRNPVTLDLCRRLGLPAAAVATRPAAADQDVVVECTGAAEGLGEALRRVRPRGRVVLKSTYAGGSAIDLAPIVIHEIRVIGSRCGPFPEAIELLRSRRVQVDPLVSAVYPLERGAEAFAAAADPANVKILLKIG